MTIKEIEQRSGMTRANIRFYEQQGLLEPARQENGYRDYSDADLLTLQRIRLLRLLGMGLEDIRAVQQGMQPLSEALSAQLSTLELQQQDAQQRLQLCRALQRDGADYASLDAQHWLSTLDSGTVPAEDAVDKVRAPIRRLFARIFDLYLYRTVWMLLLMLVGKSPTSQSGAAWNALATLAALMIMLLVEPLLLKLFGTTAGKWVLGLSVTAEDGSRLTYNDGLYRTWLAMWNGAGCGLPIYTLFPLYRNYYDCIEGKTLPWEYESSLTLKDEKTWRIAAYTGGIIAMVAALVLSTTLSFSLPNKGDLTVAQFAENFNHYADYYETEDGFRLDENGRWTAQVTPAGDTIAMGERWRRNDFLYTESFGGKVQSVRFTQEWVDDSERWIPTFQNMMNVSVFAFVQAQDPTPLTSDEVQEITRAIARIPFESFDFTAHGVRITFDITHSGYFVAEASGLMTPDPSAESTYCKVDFTITKIAAPGA